MSNLLFDPIKTQSKVTNNVIVAFSGGKDSIVTLDLCKKYFPTVEVFFMYLVPNLDFQERMLQWYENKYGLKIHRIPHFELSEFMKWGTFRPMDIDIPLVKINDVYSYIRNETGIYWIAAGERAADSMVRNAMLKKSGAIDKKRGRFYPVMYWKKNEILEYIKQKKLYLSPEQRDIGFSFRGFTGKELSIIKNRFPDDYKKILDMFPFAGAAAERYEKYGK